MNEEDRILVALGAGGVLCIGVSFWIAGVFSHLRWLAGERARRRNTDRRRGYVG